MTGALLACLVAAGPPWLTVRVLERHRPEAAEAWRDGERHRVEVRDGRLRLDGAPAEAPLALPAGHWRLEVEGAGARSYPGAPTFRVEDGRLAISVRMVLEDYVALAVASETLPGTPLAALQAQAVVARSWALASRGRHGADDLCDLAHCQVLAAEGPEEHARAASAAARLTTGEVLLLPSGQVARAPFHAACGGHTADPRELFGGEGDGAGPVADPGCPAAAWTAAVPTPLFAAVLDDLLGPGGAGGGPLDGLLLRRGAGGFLVQVERGGAVAAGDALARRLDAALGRGAVRSSRFEVRQAGGLVLLSGSGLGHGAGLCQAGAARRAAAGEGYRAILRRYFPGALPGPLPAADGEARHRP